INPIYGLYTGIVATIIGAFSTGSPLIIVTLTNTLAISAASVLTETGNEGSLGVLFMLTVMVGVFQLLMGVFKMDKALRFISNGVMTGFVFGSALLIILGQLEHFTGYHSTEEFPNEFAQVRDLLAHYADFDLTTILVGVVTIILIVLLQKIKRIEHSAYAIGLIIMTVFVMLSDRITTALVGDHTSIPSGMPTFAIPDLSAISFLIIPAFAVAIIGLIDAAGVVAIYGSKKSKKKWSIT
ncbi:MAG: SulP family inorganic anion transporter, partial [Patescibacteria group bacterium]|nr:SulP family inorganic anion transporter [Patescibacteria group bacterium]